MIQLHGPARNVPNTPGVTVARGTIYTCSMHPQIRRDVPGNCPICGMTLEPDDIPEAEGTSRELKDMTRRFVIGAILATPIFVLEMGGHLPQLNLDHYVSMAMSMWVQFALATPIVLWCAWPFFQRAWVSILNLEGRTYPGLLRSRSGSHCTRFAWPGDRIARAGEDRRRHSVTLEAGTEDNTTRQAGRHL
jgi:hypothetical protein